MEIVGVEGVDGAPKEVAAGCRKGMVEAIGVEVVVLEAVLVVFLLRGVVVAEEPVTEVSTAVVVEVEGLEEVEVERAIRHRQLQSTSQFTLPLQGTFAANCQ